MKKILEQNYIVKFIDSVNNWFLVEYQIIVNDNQITENGWINRNNLRKLKLNE